MQGQRAFYIQLRTHEMRRIKTVKRVWLGFLILMIFIGGSTSLAAPPDLLDAARKGDLKRIQKLLDSGADVNQRDTTGFTDLHWACNGQQARGR